MPAALSAAFALAKRRGARQGRRDPRGKSLAQFPFRRLGWGQVRRVGAAFASSQIGAQLI
jgi:hypothetical protein